jgi:ADP-ribose pyrophosphatase YjhB (NUDIX family)
VRLPGGGVAWREDHHKAAVRELREEVGVTLDLQARPARSTSAVCASHDRRKIAAAQAYVLQFPIVKLIELADLCCCPVACRQSGRKATQLHADL